MSWSLPTSVTIGGAEYGINTDYRDILEIIGYLDSGDTQQGTLTALYCFYENFESIPRDRQQEALRAMLDFIACGQRDEDAQPRKLIDWEQDANLIAAEVSKVAGYEIRNPQYTHWFTFIGYYQGVGEGQLSTIVSIRSKKAKGKKLEKWEQEFYRENKNRVDFVKKYSQTEEEEKTTILRLLGE